MKNDGGGSIRVFDQLRAVLTGRKRVAAQPLTGELIALAQHELRAPLTAIIGFTATMRRHGERLTLAQRDEQLDIIAAQAALLRETVENLALATNEIKLIPNTRTAITSDLPELRNASSVHVAPDLVAQIDPLSFRAVMINLLRGAAAVHVRRDDGHVAFSVIRERKAGEGLSGLVVRRLVEAHGGTVVSSPDEVTVRLPAAPAGELRQTAPVTSASADRTSARRT